MFDRLIDIDGVLDVRRYIWNFAGKSEISPLKRDFRRYFGFRSPVSYSW
ncbi:hypothetical protein ACRTEV_03970 [Rossellomorea arthrocnemi]